MKKINLSKMVVATAMLMGLGAAGVATLAPLSPQMAWADDNGQSGMKSSLSVSPTYAQIVLVPGETYTGSIKVSNPADAQTNLKYAAHVGSYVKTGDGEGESSSWTADSDRRESYNEILDWITLSNEEGEVAPNGSAVITYTINVPENAPAGGQYAAILVANDTDRDKGSGSVSIEEKMQIASLIYADVTGETVREGQILRNELPGFLTAGPLEAYSSVQNDGNVHTDATYVLQVWPLFSDEEICTNEEDPAETQVMPGTKQYHAESCNLGAVAGIFKAKQTVSIFGETSIVEKYVVLCPVWLMLIILIIIVAIIVAIVHIVRKNSKKKH